VLPVHDLDMLKYIARLDEGEDLTDVSNPLRDCILGLNDISIEDALICDSSHINSLDVMGFTPLHLAVMRGDIQKTKSLLRHHALVDIKTGPSSQTGRRPQTSLHIAVENGCLALVSVLVSHGANVNERMPSPGETPLHVAASQALNPAETIKLLLEMGADPNLDDDEGLTPLHYLAEGHSYWSAEDDCSSRARAASYLVQHGVDPNQQDLKGRTPIIFSVMWKNLPFLRYLCQIGARLDITARWGVSVFHVLAMCVHPGQVAYLSSLQIRGVDPDAANGDGNTSILLMEYQTHGSYIPGHRTHLDAFAFCALIVEIRWRNWDSGHFLHRRDQFIQEGRRQRVYRWLGWKWQQLQDCPHLAEEKWGGNWADGFASLNECEDVESVESFCIDGLFEAKEDGDGSCYVTHALEGEEDGYTSEEEEFFDVEE